MNPRVDLNADVGESFGQWTLGDDEALIPQVTSVNVACGFHAGNPTTMRRTLAFARRAGVAVGAHPGLPDSAGFGRRDMVMPPGELEALTLYQIGALAALAVAEGTRLGHVKPHGALYNMAARERSVAAAVAQAVRTFDAGLVLVGLAGSELIKAGRESGLRVASEAFADRGYAANGTLLPRSHTAAVIDDPAVAAHRALLLVRHGTVPAHEGGTVCVGPVDTICIHGDTPGAAAVAAAVRKALLEAGVDIRPFDVASSDHRAG